MGRDNPAMNLARWSKRDRIRRALMARTAAIDNSPKRETAGDLLRASWTAAEWAVVETETSGCLSLLGNIPDHE